MSYKVKIVPPGHCDYDQQKKNIFYHHQTRPKRNVAHCNKVFFSMHDSWAFFLSSSLVSNFYCFEINFWWQFIWKKEWDNDDNNSNEFWFLGMAWIIFFWKGEKKYGKILYDTITHHAGHTFMSYKYKKLYVLFFISILSFVYSLWLLETRSSWCRFEDIYNWFILLIFFFFISFFLLYLVCAMEARAINWQNHIYVILLSFLFILVFLKCD